MDAEPLILPAGDSALAIEFENRIDPEVNRRVHALAAELLRSPLEGLLEPVPSYRSLLVHYDPLLRTHQEMVRVVRGCLERASSGIEEQPRLVEIPAVYGGERGPDLPGLAALRGLSEEQVIRLHAETEYRVYMIGFTPGFPYMGEVVAAIAAPRLKTPRTHVPAGSIGIAGQQTGIYPIESPGGWQIIAHTPLKLFDPQRDPPSLLAPGDRVRFVPVADDGAGHVA